MRSARAASAPPRRGPGMAGSVEAVVDPGQRAHAGVGVDRRELPVAVRRLRGARRGDRARSAGTAAPRASRAGRGGIRWPLLPAAAPDELEVERPARAGAARRRPKGSGACRRSSGTSPRAGRGGESRTGRPPRRCRPAAAAVSPGRRRSCQRPARAGRRLLMRAGSYGSWRLLLAGPLSGAPRDRSSLARIRLGELICPDRSAQ